MIFVSLYMLRFRYFGQQCSIKEDPPILDQFHHWHWTTDTIVESDH